MSNLFVIIVGVFIIGLFLALLVKVLELADRKPDGDLLDAHIDETNGSLDELTRMFVALGQKVDYADELRVAEGQQLQENINRKANGITRRLDTLSKGQDGVVKSVQALYKGVEWKDEQ